MKKQGGSCSWIQRRSFILAGFANFNQRIRYVPKTTSRDVRPFHWSANGLLGENSSRTDRNFLPPFATLQSFSFCPLLTRPIAFLYWLGLFRENEIGFKIKFSSSLVSVTLSFEDRNRRNLQRFVLSVCCQVSPSINQIQLKRSREKKRVKRVWRRLLRSLEMLKRLTLSFRISLDSNHACLILFSFLSNFSLFPSSRHCGTSTSSDVLQTFPLLAAT